MNNFLVTLAPTDRRPWTLRVRVSAKSKNDARTQALRKARPWLADREVRVLRVEAA